MKRENVCGCARTLERDKRAMMTTPKLLDETNQNFLPFLEIFIRHRHDQNTKTFSSPHKAAAAVCMSCVNPVGPQMRARGAALDVISGWTTFHSATSSARRSGVMRPDSQAIAFAAGVGCVGGLDKKKWAEKRFCDECVADTSSSRRRISPVRAGGGGESGRTRK